ncbi:hypothetical protein Tco_0024188 [Tanacetum coccineum]
MSTLVFVDPKSSTQADGAQSSRVPVPLPKDPYEAIRQAYLVGTNTESEPIEDLGTESPESPHVVASPISFPDSTPPVGHVEETARMAVRVQPMMSPGCSARIAEVVAISDVAFRKRFRSPYESSPSPSPTLPVRKRYRGMSELVLSTDSEANELGNKDDSLDSDSGSEGVEDEGPAAGDEDPGMRDEGFGLGEDEALAAEEDQRYSTFEVGQDSKDGTIYIDVPTYPPPAPPSPDWTPGSLPIFPSHSNVSSPVSSPLISLTVPSPVATPTATIPVDEDQFIEVGAQLELYGGILQDHTQRLDALPPTLFAEIDRDVRELYTRSGVVRDEIFS